MTSEEFLAFYPQFAGPIPALVLEAYVTQANARFEEFLEDAEEARRLYTAHKLTLWAKAVPASSDSGSVISLVSLSSAGDGTRISGKRVENVSVTYSSGTSSSASGSFEDLEETVYGKQLLSLLKLFSFPRYIP